MGVRRRLWPSGGSQWLRRSLAYSTAEGTLAAASENLGINYVALFAVAMGASALEVSLLTAIPNLLANSFQLPFGRLAERTGKKKLLWIIGNTIVRWVWVPMAALPWLIHDRTWLIYSLLALVSFRGLGMAIAIPAWTSLMANLTHRSWRGAYFALRNILANLVALAASVVAGYLIKGFGYPVGYAVAFGAAWFIGIFSLLVILPIHDPAAQTRVAPAAGSAGGTPARDAPGQRRMLFASDWLAGGPARWKSEAPGFYEYAVAAFLWNTAVHLPIALFPVHFTQQLYGTEELWGIANGATFLTTILGQRYWGRLCDRVGQRPVMIWSGVWAAMLPVWWAIIPSPEWVVAINVVGGLAWAGYNLAAFNLILEVTPDSRRPSYVAVFNLGVGVAASAGPILGGWLAEYVGTAPVMALSGVFRLASLALFARWSGMRVAWKRERLFSARDRWLSGGAARR